MGLWHCVGDPSRFESSHPDGGRREPAVGVAGAEGKTQQLGARSDGVREPGEPIAGKGKGDQPSRTSPFNLGCRLPAAPLAVPNLSLIVLKVPLCRGAERGDDRDAGHENQGEHHRVLNRGRAIFIREKPTNLDGRCGASGKSFVNEAVTCSTSGHGYHEEKTRS